MSARDMMLKDLRITRLFWAPAAFSYLVSLLVAFESPPAYLAMGVVLTAASGVLILTIDDRFRTDPLYAALPGTRRSIVAGRYLTWGVATAAGLALFLGATLAITAALGDKAASLVPLLSAWGAASFVSASALAGLVLLPLYFRFGLGRSLLVFAAVGVLAVVLALLVPAGALPAPSPPGPSGPGVALLGGPGRIAAWAGRILARPGTAAAAMAGLAVLAWVSFRLSADFYERRDL